jgi:hypothetical protein
MQWLDLAGFRRALMAHQGFGAERDRFARCVGDGFSGGKCYPARRRIGARSINHPSILCASMR